MWKLAFNLKNSPTILLPAWYKTLAVHRLSPHMMPCDISTCWNSTFDMLEFTIQYRSAIDAMTAAHHFGLCQCELVPAEWKVAGELQEILKVSILLLLPYNVSHWVFDPTFKFLKMQCYSFLEAPRISRQLFLPWTSLTAWLSWCRKPHTSIVLGSVPPSLLGLRLWINTIIRQIIQKSIVLPWVRDRLCLSAS